MLRTEFVVCMKLYEKVASDQATNEELSLALEKMTLTLDLIRKADLFSPGEKLYDMSTASLLYFPLSFYRAHSVAKSQDMSCRVQNLERATEEMTAFIEQCRDLEGPNHAALSDFLQYWEEGDSGGKKVRTGEMIREKKIAAYKAEKARMKRVEHLISYLSAIEGDDDEVGAIDSEEEERELNILQIESCCSKAMQELEMMKQELALLQHRRDLDDAQVSSGRQALHEQPPPSNGIQVTRMNKVNGRLLMERDVVKGSVFTPRMQGPSMTLGEFAQQEMEQLAERERRSAEAGPQDAPTRRYEHLVRDGDEDNADLVEEATYADRDWDAFKEANPKGWGNKHGKRF